MAFDLSTAKPVSGFDLTSAQPVVQQTKKPLLTPEQYSNMSLLDKVRLMVNGRTPEQPKPTLADELLASNTGRLARGAKDVVDAGAQVLVHSLPESVVQSAHDVYGSFAPTSSQLDQSLTTAERNYQTARERTGQTGFDVVRAAGNTGALIPLLPSASAGLIGRVVTGGIAGGGAGVLQPVYNVQDNQDFWNKKTQQVKTGATIGAAAPLVIGGVSRVISPKASTNPELQGLRQEGVTPTVGQTLGGRFATTEEKLQSLPIMGDMIHRSRGQTLESFNTAAINRALRPIGKRIQGSGQDAVKEAGDLLSQHYDDALSQVQGVKFDSQFDQQLNELQGMASNLTEPMKKRFDKAVNDILQSRMSPNQSMLGDVYKKVDSELGLLANRYGKSSAASEQELGDAVSQLKNLLQQQMFRTNPDVAAKLKAADTGWANLVRIEQAAKAAKNKGGVFTPAQLNSAIQSADSSVRKRAVARGTALLQDLGNPAQEILGSKYPDSGTAGRLALGGLGLGAGYVNPAIPLTLAGGGAMYTRPVQNALVSMIADRPDWAQPVANNLFRLSPAVSVAGPSLFRLSGSR